MNKVMLTLNSIMFLLILGHSSFSSGVSSFFKFHYVSINSDKSGQPMSML